MTRGEFAELVAATKTNTENIAEVLKILRGNGHDGMVIVVDRLNQTLNQSQNQMQILTGRVQRLEDLRAADEQREAVNNVNAVDWRNRLDEIAQEVKALQGARSIDDQANAKRSLVVEVVKGVVLPISFMVIGQLIYIFGNLILSGIHH